MYAPCRHIADNMFTCEMLCSCGCMHLADNMYSHCIHIAYTRKCIPAMCIPVADRIYL